MLAQLIKSSRKTQDVFIEKLPQLIPAEENGIPTPIMFAYPINYLLGNNF